ncbi:hypothetical protein CLOM_g21531 [Closterium sp. NIES-68]|nr:hypothetical protein CLOM_g21531 [Closterium sp. NIES-68]GJP66207.1 hypothetical protein CLOP_g23108 [Closterium sp. NIES-67]
MARLQSPSSAFVLTFSVLLSASLWAATLPRVAHAVDLSYVLEQIRNKTLMDPYIAGISAGMVEFAAGYDKVKDITGGSLVLPEDNGWTSALAGYKAKNPTATTASDPVLEALDTIVNQKGSVSSLNSMSNNGKNAMSRLAKFLAVRDFITPSEMTTGKYKSGKFSLSTLVNQPIFLYGGVTGATTSLDHAFTGTDLGLTVSSGSGSGSGGSVTESEAGGPKAVARVNGAFQLVTSTQVLGTTTSSSDMTFIVTDAVVFPANMGSLTSYDPVSPYGKAAGSFALSGNYMALVLSLIGLLALV